MFHSHFCPSNDPMPVIVHQAPTVNIDPVPRRIFFHQIKRLPKVLIIPVDAPDCSAASLRKAAAVENYEMGRMDFASQSFRVFCG